MPKLYSVRFKTDETLAQYKVALVALNRFQAGVRSAQPGYVNRVRLYRNFLVHGDHPAPRVSIGDAKTVGRILLGISIVTIIARLRSIRKGN